MTDIPKEKRSHALRTGIIVFLATVLTSVSLAMITVSAWERSATLLEAILVALLSGSVALSAHLLPALVKRRVGKFSGSMVMIIWGVAVLITLYSHTVFFVTNMTQSGENRAQQSNQVKDISTMAATTQAMANNSSARSKVDITRDIANNDIQLQNYISRRCTNPTSTSRCKKVESGIEALKSKQNALNTELEEANRVADLKDRAFKMQEEAMKVKQDKRLDPVTEKLSLVFNGLNVDAITLIISVVNSALLEMLASLFWWLVWPEKKEENKVKDVKFESKLNRKSQSLKGKNLNSNHLDDSNSNDIEYRNDEDPVLLEMDRNVIKAALPVIKEGKIVYRQGYVDRTEEDLFISQYVQRIIMSNPDIYIGRNRGNIISEDVPIMSYVRRIDVVLVEIEKPKKSVSELYAEIENKQASFIHGNSDDMESEIVMSLDNDVPRDAIPSEFSTSLFDVFPHNENEEAEAEPAETEQVIGIKKEEDYLEIIKEVVEEVNDDKEESNLEINNELSDISNEEMKSETLNIIDFVSKVTVQQNIEENVQKELDLETELKENDVANESKIVNSKFAYLKEGLITKDKTSKENIVEEKQVRKQPLTIVKSVPTNTDKLPMENGMSKINSAFNRKVVEEQTIVEKIVIDNDELEDFENSKKNHKTEIPELRKWGKFAEEKKVVEVEETKKDENKEAAEGFDSFYSGLFDEKQ